MKKIVTYLVLLCILLIGCDNGMHEKPYESVIPHNTYYLFKRVHNFFPVAAGAGSDRGFTKGFMHVEVTTVCENKRLVQMFTFSQPLEIAQKSDWRCRYKNIFFGPQQGSYLLEKDNYSGKNLFYPCVVTSTKETGSDEISYHVVNKIKDNDWDPLANQFELHFDAHLKELKFSFEKKDVGEASYAFLPERESDDAKIDLEDMNSPKMP
jgi:hypothetical protein